MVLYAAFRPVTWWAICEGHITNKRRERLIYPSSKDEKAKHTLASEASTLSQYSSQLIDFVQDCKKTIKLKMFIANSNSEILVYLEIVQDASRFPAIPRTSFFRDVIEQQQQLPSASFLEVCENLNSL